VTPGNLERTVAYWQKKILAPLGIGHWKIIVNVVDEIDYSPTIRACVRNRADYDESEMEFQREFIESADLREIDEVIVHELMHIAFRDLWECVTDVQRWMSEREAEMYHQRLKHEEEGVIDRVARTLVSLHNPGFDVVPSTDMPTSQES
jgi:hypothetical protein